MLKYVKGNLLDAPEIVIVHQCNAMDTMGSGVALAIKKKYPKAYEDYVSYFELIPSKNRMGLVQFSQIDDTRIVANLIGQYHYLPRGERHTSYDALTNGFKFIKMTYSGNIAMPKIGCGLGGGDWKIVSNIIETIFDDRDVTIYEL